MFGKPEHELLGRINEMVATNILDESDELLNCRVQLVYSWGRKEPLQAAQTRFDVAIELLKVLSTSDIVAQMLRDPDVAEVTQPQEGLGRNPLVRLVPGVNQEASFVIQWVC